MHLGGVFVKLVTFKKSSLNQHYTIGAIIDRDKIVDLGLDVSDMIQFFEQDCMEDAQKVIDTVQQQLKSGVALSNMIFSISDVQLLAPFPRPISLRDFGVFKTHMDAAARITGKEISPEWFKLPNYYRGSTSPTAYLINSKLH